MEEFTHTLLENGSVERRENQYVLTRDPSGIQVPDTIQGIIAARMDRLEDSLKRIMQVAAVIGREFAFRVLQAITGTQEELNDRGLLGAFYARLGACEWWFGRIDQAIQTLTKAIELCEAEEKREDIGRAYMTLQ
jgi:predicted ATPase